MRALAALLTLALLSPTVSAQVVIEPPGDLQALVACNRSVGFIGRPILDLESFLRVSGHTTRVALVAGDVPALLASGPEVLMIVRTGADAARANASAIDAWVRAGGLLITEFTATQVLYEAGPLHYLSGALVDDFWIPSGTACGGNAIRVELPDHPLAEGLPAAWPCSGDPMGTFQVFAGVDPRLCVVLSVIGSDRDGDGRDDPVLGVTRVGLGSVAAFFSDIANFQPLEDPRVCPGGPSTAQCRRTLLDEQVLQLAVCRGDEPAECAAPDTGDPPCGDCDALRATLAAADIDNEGVRNSLEAQVRHACEQIRRERAIPAGNALCALLHHLDAQDGVHLSAESADDLRRCVRELSEAQGLRPTLPLIGCGGRRAPGLPGGRPARP